MTKSLTPLYDAANAKDEVLVEHLIKSGANPNERSSYGPVITVVSANGMIRAVKLLIEAGADVNAVDRAGWSSLHYATTHGYSDVMEFLLDHGANVNCQNKKGVTPLMLSSTHINSTVKMELLLRYGADMEVKMNDGSTVLIIQIENEAPVHTIFLLRHGADTSVIDPYFKTPRKISAAHKWLEQKAPIFNAAITGDISDLSNPTVWKLNLEQKDSWNRTTLMYAAQFGSLEAARLLLEHGAKLDTDVPPGGHTALTFAAEQGHADVVELLISYGDNIDKRTPANHSPLTFATRLNRIEVVKKLIELSIPLGVKLDFEQAYTIADESDYVEIKALLKPYVSTGATSWIKNLFPRN